MAFTGSPTGSTQYNLLTGVTQGGASGGELTGRKKITIFEYTHSATAGAGTGEINLAILPPQAVVLSAESKWGVSVAWVATSVVSIGTRAWTEPDGDVIAASAARFVSAAAVGAAVIADTVFALPAAASGLGGFTRFNARAGVTIFATVGTANITVGGTLNGFITWADPS